MTDQPETANDVARRVIAEYLAGRTNNPVLLASEVIAALENADPPLLITFAVHS
jgi:hypothetical protein